MTSLFSRLTFRHLFLPVLLFALFCGSCCAADDIHPVPVYLPEGFAGFRPLPPPPPDDSPAGMADLMTVLRLQAERTSDQIARTRQLADHTAFMMGARAWGPDFNAENMPESAKIFKALHVQARPVIASAKKSWARARPYERDARVRPCVNRPGSESYPSGHSALSAVWAGVMAAAFPEKAAFFQAQVEDTMWSRIVGGAHYPTDTQAGRILGEEIARCMLRSEDMQEALAIIRREWAEVSQKSTTALSHSCVEYSR